MSAYFLCLRLSGPPIGESEIEPMISAGRVFARDDQQLVLEADYAISYQAFWTTQEDVNARNPLRHPKNGYWYIYHGRVDNRSELIHRYQNLSTRSTDVECIAEAHAQDGDDGLKLVKGPRALVVFDPTSKNLNVYRDFAGMRFLASWHDQDRLIIANTLDALIAYPNYTFVLDEYMAACRFGFQIPKVNRTFADGIRQLTPGFTADLNELLQGRESVFYLPDPNNQLEFECEEDCISEFKRLLDQSVKRRLRSRSEVGSMLSGGLDSMPITLAASNCVPEQDIHCFTWVYDRYEDTDERQFIEPMVRQRANLKSHDINCDERWFDVHQNPDMLPSVPFHTPWLANQYAALELAQDQQVSVLLSGLSGDILYEEDWVIIYDLLKQGKFRMLRNELGFLIKNSGGVWPFVKRYIIAPTRLMKVLRPWLVKAGIVNKVRHQWLTDYSLRLISQEKKSHLTHMSEKARRPTQFDLVLGFLEPNDHVGMRPVEASRGIEKRQPFRDADLIEFMLAIPTQYLRTGKNFRPIIKRAYRQGLPTAVLERSDKADFFPTISEKIEGSQPIKQLLSGTDTHFSKYVKKQYLEGKTPDIRKMSMIRWNSAYLESWFTHYFKKVGR